MHKVWMRWMAALALVLVFVTSAQAEDKQVGVLWIGKSGMAERVSKGLVAQLKEKAPAIAVEFKPALPDENAAKAVYDAWQEEKAAIVFLRSNAVPFLVKNPSKIPVFIGACNNPVALGAMDDMEAPGGKITGVTYFLPARQQVELYRKIWPELKSLALLCEKGHPGAAIDTNGTREACQALGIEYKEALCANKAEVLLNAKALAEQVDLLVMGSQALVTENAAAIVGIAGKTPLVSYAEKPIKQGAALCGLVPDDVKLGRLLADSVVEAVAGGTDPGKIAVKTDPEPRFLVSQTYMDKIGVEIPADLKATVEIVR